MGKTWVERHPHPGEAPAKPADEHPTESKALNDWWVARNHWDVYVLKLRRHEIAGALDRLDASGDPLRPEQTIARNLGASWLDGSMLQIPLGLL